MAPRSFSEDLARDESEGPERSAQNRQLSWEQTVMKKLTAQFGGQQLRNELRREAKAETGKPRLLCSYFNRKFPDFPFHVVPAVVPFTHKMAGLNKRFTKTPLYKAWEAANEIEEASDKPLAIVFSWSKMMTAVMYNCRPVLHAAVPGLVIIKILNSGIYTIESFQRWCEVIRTDWSVPCQAQ